MFNRYLSDAQEHVESTNPYEFCRKLLGIGFLRSLNTWLSGDALVAFGFSSVYGFVDGGVNIPLSEALAAYEAIGVEELESWQPYQVLDPFSFMVSGEPIGSEVKIIPAKDLGYSEEKG